MQKKSKNIYAEAVNEYTKTLHIYTHTLTYNDIEVKSIFTTQFIMEWKMHSYSHMSCANS